MSPLRFVALVVVVSLAAVVAVLPHGSAAAPLKVTEVFDNTYANDGWNRGQERSRAAVETALVLQGYDVHFHPVANLTDAEAFNVMDKDAADGTDLFIVHNVRFKNATNMIAQKYPNAHFITTPSVGQYGGNRTYQMYYNFYQGGFIAGVTCALMSKTGRVGVLANSFMRGAVGAHNAFYLGAKSVNSSIGVYLIQIDDVSNAVEELQTARMLVSDYGVDCGLGASLVNGYQGFTEMGAFSVGIFGFDRYTVGDLCLGTIALDFSSLVKKAIVGKLNNTWPGGQVDWGVLGTVVNFAELSPMLPAQTRRSIQATIDKVMNGEERIFCGDRVAPLYGTKYVGNDSACLPDAQIRTMAQWLPGIINPRNMTYNASLVISYANLSSSNGYGIFIFIVAIIWELILCGLFVFLGLHWRTKAVIRKSPVFLVLILAGSALMTIGIFLQYGRPNAGSCLAQVWLVCLGFVLMYGSAAAKNWRIWYIFSNKNLEVFKIDNWKLFSLTMAPLITIMIILLAIWTGVSPYTAHQLRLDPSTSIEKYDLICASSSSAMEIVTFVFAMLILFSAATIALLTRGLTKNSQLAKAYNETLALGVSCLIVALYIIALAVVFIFEGASTVDRRAIIITILIAVPSIVLPISIFLNLLIGWWKGTLENEDSSSGSPGLTTAGTGTRSSSRGNSRSKSPTNSSK